MPIFDEMMSTKLDLFDTREDGRLFGSIFDMCTRCLKKIFGEETDQFLSEIVLFANGFPGRYPAPESVIEISSLGSGNNRGKKGPLLHS